MTPDEREKLKREATRLLREVDAMVGQVIDAISEDNFERAYEGADEIEMNMRKAMGPLEDLLDAAEGRG